VSTSTARVTTGEIAAALGSPSWPVDLAAELGITTAPDWAGRATVTVDQARQLVDTHRARSAAARGEWADYERQCREWTAGRTAAVQDAYRQQYDKYERAGRTSASCAEHGREAALYAGRQYERNTPRPAYHGEVGYGHVARLEYLREDELTPVVGRVREAVRRRAEQRDQADDVTESVA
jgi:hypothetical protein